MKKLLIFITMMITSAVLTSCTTAQAPSEPTATVAPTVNPQVTQTVTATKPAATENFIGEEKAEQIALEKAGLTADAVSFTNIDLDRDDGIWKYEVEFRQGKTEYEADINAVDGSILKWEMDTD